jgi:hypothetical protein
MPRADATRATAEQDGGSEGLEEAKSEEGSGRRALERCMRKRAATEGKRTRARLGLPSRARKTERASARMKTSKSTAPAVAAALGR